MRDKSTSPDGETRLFAIENAEWKALATKLAESGIGIDFFAASPGGGFMDLTTIGIMIFLILYCSRLTI